MDYSISEMKKFMKTLGIPKQKKEMCIAGIEMYLFTKEDLKYIADPNTSLDAASNFLHKKIMDM